MAQTNSRDAVMQAAVSLFTEKGYTAAGISEIVQNAGVTKPTLYYFFGSKEGLLEAILQEHYAPFIGKVREAARYDRQVPADYDDDIYPVLCAVARTYFDFAAEHREFYLLMLSMRYANPGGEAASLVRRWQEQEQEILLSMFVNMSKAHGNLKDKTELMAVNFLAMIQNAVSLWHGKGCPLDRERIHTTVRLFMHGIFA